MQGKTQAIQQNEHVACDLNYKFSQQGLEEYTKKYKWLQVYGISGNNVYTIALNFRLLAF